ncbi:MAG: 30S ribosomal protein S16 [Waddliaceae bacterium]
MALKIRLRQQGRTNRHFYRVVVTDCGNSRDGRYVEALGWYNPFEADAEKNLNIKEDRVQFWIDRGAVLTTKAEALVARAAPNVIKSKKEKEIARKAKTLAKKKARRKAKA